MSKIYFVTYATHEQGMFKQLINNEHGVKIEVLGMGLPWNGYFDKIKGFEKFISDKQPDDIVVFLDGFDTIVNTGVDDLLKHFRSYGAKILISLDHGVDEGSWLEDWSDQRVFGSCKGQAANAGLYMGEVSELKKMWRNMKRQGTEDDQRAMNSACSNSSLDISIDSDRLIFENKTRRMSPRKHEPIFVSFPFAGDPDITWYDYLHRIIWRGCSEYIGFFIPEIVATLIILFGLYLYFNYKF